MIYKIVVWIVKIATSIMCRIDAPDLDKVPMRGPLIVYSNHTGQIEVSVLFAHLQPRPLIGWAKAESWDNAFLHWVFNLWGLIPIRRGEADTVALRKAMAALEKGCIFGIAPEGHRNITGQLKRAHPGTVLLALHSKAPLLPLAHWGGENFLKNLVRFKRTDFHVRVGEPFYLNTAGVRITRETRQQIVDEMMCHLAELLPPEYRGEYEKVTKSTSFLVKASRITEADLA